MNRAFEIWRYAYERGDMAISVSFVESIARSAIGVLQQDLGGQQLEG